MNRSDLKILAASRSYPSVSILAPMHRVFPDRRQDPIRVRNLVNEASERLRNQFGKQDAEPVLAGLEELAARIDFQHPQDGVALFVSRETKALHYLPFPVRERIVIDETFATRDLVYSLNRSPRYWVLSLNERPTRLFQGVRDHLVEIEKHGFPMFLENPLADDKTPQGNMVSKPGHRHERLRNFFRHVDTALTQAIGPESLPLVLTGVETNIASFTDASRHKNQVLVTVAGNHDATTPHALAALLWPQIEAAVAARQEQIFRDLKEAVGTRRVASGLGDVWRAAREGRGDLLVVERDYHTPARVDDTGLVLTPLDRPDGPGSMEDAVDELVESVFLRGGRFAFVDNGTLSEHNQVALILRY